MSSRFHGYALLLLGGALVLAGCGIPGAPQPPSLDVPKPVDDLTATRQGNRVTLTWTPPTQTTDGTNLRHAGTTEVCRGVNDFPMGKCDEKVATLNDAQVEHATKSTVASRHDASDELPIALQQQNPLGEATYALSDLNRNGRTAGLSNQVRVPLAPTLSPPKGVETKVTAEGVLVSWAGSPVPVENSGLRYMYRVFRKSATDEQKPELIVGEVPAGTESFLDHNVEWEQRYVYRVAGVTAVGRPGKESVEVVGDDSPTVEAFAHDVFPPAVPTGLQAVFSGVGQKPFIDLTWAPNLESDLAGYNVYRHEQGTQPVKINTDLVKTPAFRDENVTVGHEYFYAVSAVDLRGNESGKSEEGNERTQ